MREQKAYFANQTAANHLFCRSFFFFWIKGEQNGMAEGFYSTKNGKRREKEHMFVNFLIKTSQTVSEMVKYGRYI